MADVEQDNPERQCRDLLMKLKKTTESLLAGQSVQGPWGTYGALRRICHDTESILCHRMRESKCGGLSSLGSGSLGSGSLGSGSLDSFWLFLQGLRWLSPSLAPVIEKLNRYSQSQKSVGGDVCRMWLKDSVEDHSLIAQLDTLISDVEYLYSFYYDDAFLCQPDCVNAMRICFKAIELNKPALLTDISPHLLRSTQITSSHTRSASSPEHRTSRISSPGGGASPLGRSLPVWEAIDPEMGNRHGHLNVRYSQMGSSNMSLSVDPSLGGSSLLQQKILSGPCFVSSLDSPGLLESLRSDPLTDAMRSAERSNPYNHHSAMQLNEPSLYIPQSRAPHELIPQSRSPHELIPQSRSPHELIPQSRSPHELIPQSRSPHELIPQSRSSHELIPQSRSPHELIPQSRSPHELIPQSRSPHELIPQSSLPREHLGNTLVNQRPSSLARSELTLSNRNVQATESNLDPRLQSLTADPASDGHSSCMLQPAFPVDGGQKDLNCSIPSCASQSSFEDVTQEAESLLEQSATSISSCHQGVSPPGSPSSALHSHSSSASLSPCLSKNITGSQIKTSDVNEIKIQSWDGRGEASVKQGSQISLGLDASSLNMDESHSGSGDFGILLPHTRTLDSSLPQSAIWGSSKNTDTANQGLSNTNKMCFSNSELNSPHGDTTNQRDTKLRFFSVKSDPALNSSNPLLSHRDDVRRQNFHDWRRDRPPVSPTSPQLWSRRDQAPTSPRPWTEDDLYSMTSPGTSPNVKTTPTPVRSSGIVYVPQSFQRGHSLDQVDHKGGLESGTSPDLNPSRNFHDMSRMTDNTSNNSSFGNVSNQPPMASSNRKLGHKRWASDTTAIKVEQGRAEKPGSTTNATTTSSSTSSRKHTTSENSSSQNGLRTAGWESQSYQGTLTKPTEGQSLMSYLTSQDFKTCANLEKENAHFHISEALIAAFESMKWNRMMKKQSSGRKDSSSSSSDEEIHELRQRIRIRKREKMLERGRPFPPMSDGATDTATTSQSPSSPVDSNHDMSSMSGESSDLGDEEDGRDIDVAMSSDGHSNLAQLRSSGLTLSMASLYSDAELARSNQQIKSSDESPNSGSAEAIAICLLKRFSEKHLPKASELKWLVSERDAPQRLLPLPSSIPISPDDVENAEMATPNRTRLRGDMEWAPPRAQIIFSVHTPEKRATVMARQNFRCAGCGLRVDPAFIKRYRYCEYLGKYFCQCCHSGATFVIPGHVLERWHFGHYPVSTFSYSLLEKMWMEPLFHLNTINPMLYKRVRVLESIRESRQQLVHLHSLLAVCKRDPKLLKEMQKLPSHWLSNDDVYSMDDFVQVKTGSMMNQIKAFITLAISHVEDCQLCQGLGFLCGMCHDPRVIFPFQLDAVVSCQVCQACYHKECFVPDKCPKCIRMEARRRLQQEAMSPDSPDSGDNDDSTSSERTLVCRDSLLATSADGCR